MELLNDTLDLRKKKAQEIYEILEKKKYDKIENSYHYMVKIPMDLVNEENVEKIKSEYDATKELIDALTKMTNVNMYYKELIELEEAI